VVVGQEAAGQELAVALVAAAGWGLVAGLDQLFSELASGKVLALGAELLVGLVPCLSLEPGLQNVSASGAELFVGFGSLNVELGVRNFSNRDEQPY